MLEDIFIGRIAGIVIFRCRSSVLGSALPSRVRDSVRSSAPLKAVSPGNSSPVTRRATRSS